MIVNQTVGASKKYLQTGEYYLKCLMELDYMFSGKPNLYCKLLFQGIKRIQEHHKSIDLGITAAFEKRKLGALIILKVAYLLAEDNFSMGLMGIIQNKNTN